jgi:hypothetical protein
MLPPVGEEEFAETHGESAWIDRRIVCRAAVPDTAA